MRNCTRHQFIHRLQNKFDKCSFVEFFRWFSEKFSFISVVVVITPSIIFIFVKIILNIKIIFNELQ